LGGPDGRSGNGEEINHTLNEARIPFVTLVVCHFTRSVNHVRHFIAREFLCCELAFVAELSPGRGKKIKVKVPKNAN